MKVKNTLSVALLAAGFGTVFGTLVSPACAEIITPTLVSTQNENSYSTATPDKLTDNSGLDVPVNNGDSLAQAQAAVHANTGVFDSWVSNAAAPDYFVQSPAPVFVWDLGADMPISDVVLWEYQNNGGDFIRVGNHARTIEFRVNTDAEGTGAFAGPATTINMAAVVGATTPNAAQTFALNAGTARYIEMSVTDNHFGDPDGLGVDPLVGGDRVGLGEVRFNSEVPEPATWLMMSLAACFGLVSWWRRR